MNKLNKPKSFEASESIQTPIGEIANLLRSGIKNQTVFLVGHAGKWHEIEISSLRIDDDTFLENSHLESVAHYIDTNNITLSDMGIVSEAAPVPGITYQDFQALSAKYPAFDYIEISTLNDWNVKKGKKASIDVLNDDLKMLTRDGISIKEYIKRQEASILEKIAVEEYEKAKNDVVQTPVFSNEDKKQLPSVEYSEVVDESKPQQSIIVDTVPVLPAIDPKDSVSISIFENLSPAKITEIQIIRSEQEDIVKANPVITIIDKTTYNQAKKNLAILLSASTRINGTKGVFTLAKQFVNKFKSDFDAEGLAIEQLSRVPHDAQKKLIQDWDNRLLLQQQERIKQLCAVPFVFDGTQYAIGSLIVTQKDIEDKTPEQWVSVIRDGESVALALEAAKNIQNAEIEELKKQNAILLERLNALLPAPEEETESVSIVEETVPVVESPNVWVGTSESECAARTTIPQYQLPSPENKLLNALDLANFSRIETSEYLNAREFYILALQHAAKELTAILVNPDKTVIKSVEINKLCEIWR